MLKELLELITARFGANNPAAISQKAGDRPGPDAIVVANGYELKTLPGYVEPKPAFIQQNLMFYTPESLLAYLAKYGTGLTRVFADMDTRRVTAVLDYHAPVSLAHAVVAVPAERCAHLALWVLKFDAKFLPWVKAHGAEMTHRGLVEFLDCNQDVIHTPTSAELLKMMEQIEVIDSNCKVSMVARNGERSLISVKASSDVQGKDAEGVTFEPLREFQLFVPVSYGGQAQCIQVDVHWNTSGGGLKVKLNIHNYEDLVRTAFMEGVTNIVEAGHEVLMGAMH